tara:strand:- start:41 stop:331 length:291 start_codon:yes stop_codon:yes gene_type:complete
MNEFSNDKSINETLTVIKNALQEDSVDNNKEDVLVLDQLVKEDGTIESINIENIKKHEIKEILNEKLSEIFELHFEKWLNKNIPNYLEKYFSKKEK